MPRPRRRRAASLAVLLLSLAAMQACRADPIEPAGIGPVLGKAAATATGMLLTSLASSGAAAAGMSGSSSSKGAYPSYPSATDYATGMCAGYAFCFANWNPPVMTEPDVVCPSGYEITQQYGKPLCVQKLGVCTPGYDLSSTGQCCTVRTQSQCFPTWDSSCAEAGSGFHAADVGSICQGTHDYSTIINNIDVVDVNSGSRWYGGSSSDGSHQQYSSSSGSTDGVVMMPPAGSSGLVSVNDGTSDADMLLSSQVIPAGAFVNLNGQVVRVGPGGSSGGQQQQQWQQQAPAGAISGGGGAQWGIAVGSGQANGMSDASGGVIDVTGGMIDAQTIPAGSFINLGGQVVQVGRPQQQQPMMQQPAQQQWQQPLQQQQQQPMMQQPQQQQQQWQQSVQQQPVQQQQQPMMQQPIQQQQPLQQQPVQQQQPAQQQWQPVQQQPAQQQPAQSASPQQQQALQQLQAQADAAGTFVPGQGTSSPTVSSSNDWIPQPTTGGTVNAGNGAAALGRVANGGTKRSDTVADSEGEAAADSSSDTQDTADVQESGALSGDDAAAAAPLFEGITYEHQVKPQQQQAKKKQQQQQGSGGGQKQQQQKAKQQGGGGGHKQQQHGGGGQKQQQQQKAKQQQQQKAKQQQQQHYELQELSHTRRLTYVDSATAAAQPAGAQGLLLTKLLLLLPKLELPKLVLLGAAGKAAVMKGSKLVAADLLASKEVLAAKHTRKEDLLPKCFQKCCTSDADVVCTAAKQTINYAKALLVCPPGCQLAATGKCLCRAGSFSPCLPTDTVCSWGEQPICVGAADYFGVPACAFVGLLQKHLPRVQCPY